MRVKAVISADEGRRITAIDMKQPNRRIQINYVGNALSSVEFMGQRFDPAEILLFLSGLTIASIGNIANIANIENIENIEDIEAIENIKNIESIDLIDTIKEIHFAGPSEQNYILNGGFETGLLPPWEAIENPVVVTTEKYVGSYSVRLDGPLIGFVSAISQTLPPKATDALTFSLWHKSTNLKNLNVTIYYTNGTNSTHSDAGTGAWKSYSFIPDAGKKLLSIYIDPDAANMTSYIDEIKCI